MFFLLLPPPAIPVLQDRMIWNSLKGKRSFVGAWRKCYGAVSGNSNKNKMHFKMYLEIFSVLF